MESEIDTKALARMMYAAYAKEGGGVTFDGKPLPTWHQPGDDRHKCWVAAARCAKELL